LLEWVAKLLEIYRNFYYRLICRYLCFFASLLVCGEVYRESAFFVWVGTFVALIVIKLTIMEVLLMSIGVEKLTSQNFATFTGAGTVLVDFWAPWCGPCQMQLPILDAVAKRVGESVKVGKLNVEDSPDIASKFGIFSIPTLIVFRDGKPEKVFQGVQNEETLVKAVA